MTTDHVALADRLSAAGVLTPEWRAAFLAVPRAAFIPDAVWHPGDEGLQPMLKAVQPAQWLELVYSDDYVITQADDGQTAPGEVGAFISSTSSAPSIVTTMLDALAVTPSSRVLEIGTGTGWNAGIIASRIGDEQIVTVEIDPDLADRARDSLAAVGLTPRVITGDGAAGYPPGGPYDRVLSTAAVQQVPFAWVEQTRPGGRIVTPWATAYHNGTLARLEKMPDGTAIGHFGRAVRFMRLRAQRISYGAVEDRVRPDDDYTTNTTTLHPYEPVADTDGAFAVGLRVPNCQTITVHDQPDDPYITYFLDPASKSWATITLTHQHDGEHPVRQHGPRQLWDEIEAAHTWWADAGKPEHTRFGLTVRAATQWVWLDVPERIVGA